jgi:hypothetical protein
MSDAIDPYRLFLAASDLLLSVYAVGLWSFALRRTRLRFLRILVLTNVVFLVVHVIHVIIVCAEDRLKFDVFGIYGFATLSHILYVVGPITYTTTLIGFTIMVRWMLRVRAAEAAGTNET